MFNTRDGEELEHVSEILMFRVRAPGIIPFVPNCKVIRAQHTTKLPLQELITIFFAFDIKLRQASNFSIVLGLFEFNRRKQLKLHLPDN